MDYESRFKEVYFHEYCSKCKHKKLAENEPPCDECIAESKREYSHKPAFFEQKESR